MKNIPEKYDFSLVEKHWIETWLKQGIYDWNPSIERSKTFAVDTPPPTVSGSLHVGTVFGYTQQDVIVRQRRMKGLNIFYPMGWDDNGLPTERRVQNMFHVRCNPHLSYQKNFVPKTTMVRQEPGSAAKAAHHKEPPEEISRDNFIELCHQVTKQDEKVFKLLWQHLGLSIDWSLEYATIDDHCRKTSQLSFLKLLQDGRAYTSFAPHLWDVDFKTAVSQAEVEDKALPGHFHNIRFGVEGDSTGSSQADSFVIATTRPELLPACVAVIAHSDDERYKPYFGKNAITPLFRARVPIIANEKADPEKGTGILMICTFGDMMDVEWWNKYQLPLRQVIGHDGRMMEINFGAPGWASADPAAANKFYSEIKGKTAKQAQAKMVEMLRSSKGEALLGLGAPLTEEPKPIEHQVKMYEKGERPLEIIPTMQWFIRIMDLKEELLEQGRKIKWHPRHMRIRYEDWVEGLNQDWCVSRQRYFGVPIPVWYPLDAGGNPLYQKPIMPAGDQLPIDPQSRPAPGYEESQRDQPHGFTADPDVLDTWATSSMTPQIASHWAKDPERHKKTFPMDIRPQGPEIIRTWAFYTIVKAYLHEKQIPWNNALINGWIMDPDRKKMSKSQGNVVTPERLLLQFSSDGVRYWAAKARLGVDTMYDEAMFANGKRLTIKLYNAVKFAAGHILKADQSKLGPEAVTAPLDKSFIEHLKQVVIRSGKHFANFEYADALQETESFFWEKFCDNYLELIKVRAYQEGDSAGKLSALATLKFTLNVTLRLFAPFIPYFTEEAWSWMFAADFGKERSVHTSRWPEQDEFAGISGSQTGDPFGAATEVLSAVRKVKSEAKVSVKTPLKSLKIAGSSEDLKALKLVWSDLLGTVGAQKAVVIEGQVENGKFEVKAEV
ncbi:valine--tRNA ligase [candidate division TA06 bacterium]|uniref:valine--tRNA ligase n=1 Tax=candidate division TA06 bacterium TaxID=2250710 RepID=A0A933IBL6_UNCT6|nr:valine--tRNA ligase [candidate division TA06 bacterium]